MDVTVLGIETELNFEQLLNRLSLTVVKLVGRVTLASEEHPLKADFPIVVVLPPNATDVKLQPANAYSPTLVTLLGIVIFVRPAPLKA